MRRFRRPVLAAAVAVALAAAAVVAVVARSAHADSVASYVTNLNGAEETPPHATPASGEGTVTIDGDTISYELRVFNISNVIAAHIHIGAPGVAGPIVLTLITPTPLRGPFAGTLAARTITNPQLEGPLAGQPLSALAAQLAAGNAYLNVHTNDNVAPTNTGPGDFPGGEIRGQLSPASSSNGEEDRSRGRGRGR
jgi:CHRD domain